MTVSDVELENAVPDAVPVMIVVPGACAPATPVTASMLATDGALDRQSTEVTCFVVPSLYLARAA